MSWENSSQDHIYYAPELNELQSTLLQNKPVSSKENLKDKLQIIHSNGNHWIAASNVKCDADYDVAIYDSIYCAVNDEAEHIICNLFQLGEQKPKIYYIHSTWPRTSQTAIPARQNENPFSKVL